MRQVAGWLSGEVAVVTGASSGIGRALARALAREGATVVLLARRTRELEELAAEIAAGGGSALPVAADVTDWPSVRRAAEQVAARLPAVDLLVHGAGIFAAAPFLELDPEQPAQLIMTNYLGVVHVTRGFLPLLRRSRRRSIVMISSLAGKLVPPFMGAYAASKFAVTAFAHGLRQELRPEGFHVGVIHPGPVSTPMVEGHLGGPYYLLPPGVPVLTAGEVAAATLRLIRRREKERVAPGWMAPLTRTGAALPGLVDWVYRLAARPVRIRG